MTLDVDRVLAGVVAAGRVSSRRDGSGSARRDLGVLVARVKELVTGMSVMANTGRLARGTVAAVVRFESVAVISGVGAIGGMARAGGDHLLDADVRVGALVLLFDVPFSAEVHQED